MQPRTISIPTLALIGSTRGMLGAGLALLLARRLSDAHRLGIGRALLAVGVLSTIPLAWRVFRSKGRELEARPSADNESAIATPPAVANLPHEALRRGRHQMMPIAIPGMLGVQPG